MPGPLVVPVGVTCRTRGVVLRPDVVFVCRRRRRKNILSRKEEGMRYEDEYTDENREAVTGDSLAT
jgi:hypothetical protein